MGRSKISFVCRAGEQEGLQGLARDIGQMQDKAQALEKEARFLKGEVRAGPGGGGGALRGACGVRGDAQEGRGGEKRSAYEARSARYRERVRLCAEGRGHALAGHCHVRPLSRAANVTCGHCHVRPSTGAVITPRSRAGAPLARSRRAPLSRGASAPLARTGRAARVRGGRGVRAATRGPWGGRCWIWCTGRSRSRRSDSDRSTGSR